jgi:hypothetical protein
MLGEGVQRAIATYTAAVSACVKGVQMQQALGLFKRVRSERVHRNTLTYKPPERLMRQECVSRNVFLASERRTQLL